MKNISDCRELVGYLYFLLNHLAGTIRRVVPQRDGFGERNDLFYFLSRLPPPPHTHPHNQLRFSGSHADGPEGGLSAGSGGCSELLSDRRFQSRPAHQGHSGSFPPHRRFVSNIFPATRRISVTSHSPRDTVVTRGRCGHLATQGHRGHLKVSLPDVLTSDL